jgi:hypothetical protein
MCKARSLYIGTRYDIVPVKLYEEEKEDGSL